LVLKGAIVDRVLPGGSKIGLEAGDLILAYTSPRDLKLDSHHAEFASPVSLLARRAETGGTGGELRVIRRSGLVTLSVPARIEEHVLDWDVYLDQGADGFVRIEKVVVYLGMYGEAAFAPVYRLGPDAARILAPLVTRRASGEGTSLPEYARLPHADGPIVLVNLRAATRVAQTDWATPQQTREIVEARLVSTEFVMPEWVAAWKTLDEVLRDVVALSLTAPGPEKRERLAEAIARGGEAVAAMEKARETAEMRARVARIDPKARVVHTFQRRVAGQWAGTLAGCAASLRIDPPASLGAAARGSRLLEILLASPTAADFIGEVKASCGEDALDDRVLWSSSIRRAVSAWEVEGFDAEGFARLREDAKKTIEDRDAWEAERKKDRPEPEEATLQPWGVVIRRADADLKARDLILRGVKVEKVLPGGSPVGLEAGDVILDYGSIHDIVMGDFWGWPPRDLRYAAERPGARIRVLRSGRAIEIRTPSP
ncbi:MAG: hypothetical protein JXP34_07070, partial [Planctomycetes bacterium]|nr:hypothetical protein [Planctomycetota bacterium]